MEKNLLSVLFKSTQIDKKLVKIDQIKNYRNGMEIAMTGYTFIRNLFELKKKQLPKDWGLEYRDDYLVITSPEGFVYDIFPSNADEDICLNAMIDFFYNWVDIHHGYCELPEELGGTTIQVKGLTYAEAKEAFNKNNPHKNINPVDVYECVKESKSPTHLIQTWRNRSGVEVFVAFDRRK